MTLDKTALLPEGLEAARVAIDSNVGFAPFSCQFWQGEFVHFEPEDGPIHYAFERWRPLPLPPEAGQ